MRVQVNNCCTEHGPGGCTDQTISNCVFQYAGLGCATSPWDGSCVWLAQTYCNAGDCSVSVSPATCDDGVACTQGDVCTDGACGGTPSDAACEDNNECTTESCDPTDDCVYVNLPSGPCSDDDACTSGDTCVDGVCVITSEVNCDDSDVCTAESCNPATGTCEYMASDVYTLGSVPPNSGPTTGYAGSQNGSFKSAGLSCLPGYVAIGFYGASGAWMDRVGLVCQYLNVDGTFGQIYGTEVLGSSESGNGFDLRCPAGEVLVGMGGMVGGNFDRLYGLCLTLDQIVDLTSPDAGTLIGPVGGFGGSTFGLPCPAGSAMYGFQGWAGTYPHRMGFFCGTVTRDLQACDDGDVCTDADTCKAAVCQSGTPIPMCGG